MDPVVSKLLDFTRFHTQTAPQLPNNFYNCDEYLPSILKRIIPAEVFGEIEKDLINFGERVVEEVAPLGQRAQLPHNFPHLYQYDGWGKRIDEIHVCDEWKKLHDISAEEGLVSLAYERKHGEYSRLHQFTKVLLFNPLSAIVSCPLSMTDGAARLIEQLYYSPESTITAFTPPSVKQEIDEVYQHLTSRDKNQMWTSGQWMTERTGGSDVEQSQTVALPSSDSPYHFNIYGYKFFTSATTAQVAFTLARVADKSGSLDGQRLSLFVVKLRNEDGQLNNIKIHKLKDKSGTKPLPTAELELQGTRGLLIGLPASGVRNISYLFNITRIWVAMGSAGVMHLFLQLHRNYLDKRKVFGELLGKKSLHLRSLANLEISYRGTLQLFLYATHLLGKSEANAKDTQSSALLRLLTPVIKLFTAKLTTYFVQEAQELFGGFGYVNDTGLGSALADCQVNAIWEGTSNILSLDLLRAVFKHPEGIQIFLKDAASRIKNMSKELNIAPPGSIPNDVSASIEKLSGSFKEIEKYFISLSIAKQQTELVEANARNLAYFLGHAVASLLLWEHSFATKQRLDFEAARRWQVGNEYSVVPTVNGTSILLTPSPEDLHFDQLLALGSNYKPSASL